MKLLVALALVAASPVVAGAAADGGDGGLPSYLRDRGTGIRTSMFGTYVNRGEFLIYPFYEYYRDDDLQYSPNEFGGIGSQDFQGRYRANEGLLFVGYGLTDRLAIEFEAAIISATFEKDPADASGTPARIEESGLGDVEGQITYRWIKESERRPEFFSFFEAVSPQNTTKALIGTPDWELKFGSGVSRGYAFGTLTARVAAEYVTASSSAWDLGEWAVEYLRRIPSGWGFYASLEGQATDELSLVTEVQRRLGACATFKVNSSIGLTANATDFAPEVGIMFRLPTGKR
jgi:hypothetical protein